MGLSIRKNDTVTIIAGNERGKRGRVLAVYPRKGRVLVEGINMIKRHMKPNRKYTQGGIIEREAPVHRSNVMLVCPKCDRATRYGNSLLDNGKKVRVCKKCGEVMD